MSLLDSHNRPLKSLRLSVTDRCNLRCHYCMPEKDYVWLPRENILSFEELVSLVTIFEELGVDRIRITGGEPLLRKNLHELIRILADRPNIKDLALTTNGLLLPEQLTDLHREGLNRLTVSLDTLRQKRFKELTRFDELETVKKGLALSAQLFKNIKIDTVVIRGINDDEIIDMLDYGSELNAEVRFIEYMDVGGATRWSETAVVPRGEIIKKIKNHFGEVQQIHENSSAPADRFVTKNGTTFGIISSTTEPFCHSCDRSRLTADGQWYLCLYALTGIDLRKILRDGSSVDKIRQLIQSAWEKRDDRGAENRLAASNRKPLIPIETLQKKPHLEMHTRGG